MRRYGVFLLMFWLWLGPGGALAEVRSPAFQERDDWSGTYYRGHKLGFTHARVERDGPDLVVHTRVFFRLNAGGAEQSTIITQTTRLDERLRLKRFSLLQEIMGNRQRVEGRRNGGVLEYEVTTRGYQKTKTMPLDEDIYPASTVWLNVMDRGLKVGDSGTLRIFIEPFQMITPMSYRVLRAEKVKVNGREHEALVVHQNYAGMDSTLWVGKDGSILLERTPHGFESRLEDEETAQDLGPGTLSVSNLITLSLITVNRAIPDPEALEELTVRLSRLRRPDAVPEDQRQTILQSAPAGGGLYTLTLRVRPEAPLRAAPVGLPVSGLNRPEYLAETPEIQSKHPMIQALARELVGEGRQAWPAARAINRWVFRNLDKVLVDSFTALDALHRRRGECQSHTNLFAALARAAGIPTRVVNGLVYSRQYKGFLYHAWPEVYVGEWRALDPTLGQERVDATHIKLSTGNYEGALKLMEFIGQVRIELPEP